MSENAENPQAGRRLRRWYVKAFSAVSKRMVQRAWPLLAGSRDMIAMQTRFRVACSKRVFHPAVSSQIA